MRYEYGIYILGIIICLLILFKAISNYRLIVDRYKEGQISICLQNFPEDLFKPDTFFRMSNGGVSPCDPLESIEYVDYIGTNSMFMEKR